MNFWQNADNVTLHAIGANYRSWPEPVRSLSDRLDDPLPRWVYQGPHPCVSPFARSLSAELLHKCSLLSGTTGSGSCDTADDDLSRLFDAALSATATARSLLLAESGRPCSPNSKEFLLAGLVSHVVTLTAPQALVLERPSFVLPRHPKTLWNPLRKYIKTTSTATLLAGCIPEGFSARLGEGEEDDTTSDVEDIPCDSREDPPRRMTMEEFVNGRYYDDESDSSDGGSGDKTSCAPDEAPIDDSDEKDEDPFWALHMLDTPSPTDPPVIPAICMAGPGEIYALMASALYQRRVWRVQKPLIGLMLPPTGTAVQLIFGWLEDDESTEDALPNVHLAFHDATLNASAQTLFDICDPGSTLKLCLLLSNLTRTYIDHLRQMASDNLDGVVEGANKGHLLQWRLDLTRDESEGYGWRSTEERITAWAREVSILTQVTKDASSTASCNMSKKRGAKPPAGSEPSYITPDLTVSPPGSTKATPIPSQTDPTDVKRMSCSEFAAKDSDPVLESRRTLVWLADRLTFCTAFPMMSPMPDGVKLGSAAQDSAILHYEELTAYYWPAEFTREGLPSVAGDLEPLKQQLVEMNKAHEQQALLGRTAKSKPLPASVVEVIKHKFSIILRTCLDARKRHRDAKVRQVQEVEVRHEWDALLFQFLTRTRDNVWSFLERQMNLPRNQAVDHAAIGPNMIYSESVRRASDWERRNLADMFQEAQGVSTDPDRYGTAAVEDARKQLRFLPAIRCQVGEAGIYQEQALDAPNQRPIPLEKCTKKEPLTGRCDAVGTLYFRDFFAPPHKPPTASFREMFMVVDTGTYTKPKADAGINTLEDFAPPQSSESLQVPSPTQSSHAGDSSAGIRRSTRLAAKPQTRPVTSTGDTSQPAASTGGTSQLATDNTPEPSPGPFSLTRDVSLCAGVVDVTRKFEELSISQEPEDLQQSSIDREASPRGLDVPLLALEYKKLSDSNFVTQGVNQGRIYSLAVVKFLAALGITDLPVLTLVTEGSVGVVTCAYSTEVADDSDESKKHVRILESNARSFDISNPMRAFHYATFLCLVATKHAAAVKAKVEAVKSAFLEKYDKNDKSLRWSMRHQIEELEKGKGKAA